MTDMTAEKPLRSIILEILASTRGESEGHTADAILSALTAPRVPEGETVTFWVVYDATTDKKYIKKNAETGGLAMFDYEHEARAVSIAHAGTGYKQMTYINATAQSPAEQVTNVNGMLVTHDSEGRVSKIVQGESVGWQFYQDGRWWYGDDRVKDHRKNTEEAGFRVRDVYAAPAQDELAKLRERVRELEKRLEPDMFWWADDPEHAAAYDLDGLCDQIFDNNLSPSDGIQLANVRLATSLPDAVLEAKVVERDGDFYWEARLREGGDQ